MGRLASGHSSWVTISVVYGPGALAFVFCRRPAGGEALPQVQGDGEEVRICGLCLL